MVRHGMETTEYTTKFWKESKQGKIHVLFVLLIILGNIKRIYLIPQVNNYIFTLAPTFCNLLI